MKEKEKEKGKDEDEDEEKREGKEVGGEDHTGIQETVSVSCLLLLLLLLSASWLTTREITQILHSISQHTTQSSIPWTDTQTHNLARKEDAEESRYHLSS